MTSRSFTSAHRASDHDNTWPRQKYVQNVPRRKRWKTVGGHLLLRLLQLIGCDETELAGSVCCVVCARSLSRAPGTYPSCSLMIHNE